MKRNLLAAILLAGVAALPSATPTQAAVSVDLHLGNTYPVRYQRAPRTYVVPSSDVYYVPDQRYDMFRYGSRWYINDGGSWFVASSYRGPFVRVAFESVPRTVLTVPSRYHRQSRGYWGDRYQSNNWNNNHHGNNGRGYGNGNGRDRDHDND